MRDAPAAGHVGHEPGHGRADRRRRARSRRRSTTPTTRDGRRARARLHGARAGHADPRDRRSTASSSARARTRASRTCAPRPRSCAGTHVHPSVRAMVVPGSAQVKRQAEAEGLDRVFADAGFEWRERRLLDVPRHEPRHARAGRALRVDVEPQLRGPPGRGRAHAPRQPGGRRRDRDRRPLRRRARPREVPA